MEIRRAPGKVARLIDACRDDFGRFAFDGFGIMLSDDQLENDARIGPAGPRRPGDFKTNWVSGGKRSGKTVYGFLKHADANLYKRGVDRTDRVFWRNYDYGTLHIAPTDELALRMYAIGDTIAKGANDAQLDERSRRSRGGAFLDKFSMGKSGRWGIARFVTGGHMDFRSSEGRAYRLEGGQWWFATWDEWASQPDREIRFVWKDVLLARLRDHDGKLMPLAWPKPETEHHLIEVIRDIEEAVDLDSQVVYFDAEAAFFTNRKALEVERRTQDKASWMRGVKGRPAGGAAKEFKPHMLDNLWNRRLPREPELPEEGYAYFSSWDIGLAGDSTVGLTFRIPIVNGRRMVTPQYKARIVNWTHLPGGDDLTPDKITFAVAREQLTYRSLTALDATSMGGMMAFRQVRDLRPRPHEFKSRANDRIHGNMRLSAITNALDCLEWGRSKIPEGMPPELVPPWGLIEAPFIVRLNDQMLWFDRDEDHPDDWVWALNIGCWFIRRWWAVGDPNTPLLTGPQPFDLLSTPPEPGVIIVRRRRGLLVSADAPVRQPPDQVFIRDGKRFVPPVPAAKRG